MAVTTISGPNTQFGKNHLINGEMRVAQRGTSFVASANNDDVYTLDRWNLVSEGNDIVDVTQSTTVPTGGALKSIALDVETANKQFGIIQIIEANNCTGLIGNEVTFSFKAKVTNARLGDVRAGIIAWSSTADGVTSDIIATYNDDANPTLASNLTFENTPSDLGVTTSWATYSVTGTIDTGSTANVVVWIGSVDSTTTVGDFLHITDCQLEIGSNATSFERESFSVSLAKCQRYFLQENLENQLHAFNGLTFTTTAARFLWRFPVTMRTDPTFGSSTASNFEVFQGAGKAVSNLAAQDVNQEMMAFDATCASSTEDAAAQLRANTTSQYVTASAEL